jgi:hypothetical protein
MSLNQVVFVRLFRVVPGRNLDILQQKKYRRGTVRAEALLLVVQPQSHSCDKEGQLV